MERNKVVQSKKTFQKKAVEYFKEYCDYTSIHGFKYFAEDRPLCEKLWWLVSIVVCSIFCGIMINNIFHKFIQYPVIVTFSMQETTLYKIPFPAVTVCTKARISQNYFNISKTYQLQNLTEDERAKLDMATIICDEEFYSLYNNNITEKTVNITDLYEFLNMSQTNFMKYCFLMDEQISCTQTFTPILTEDGLCYTFNLLDKSEIFADGVFSDNDYFISNKSQDYHVEHGFGSNADLQTYPRRALLPGIKNSLQLVFQTKYSDIEYECSDDERGYKISLHLPGKIPNLAQEYFIVPLDQIVLGTIIPQIITTSDAVKVYQPEKRDCFFQKEKYLRFFKVYTQANCQLECLTNYTFSKCGCVAYFMPRFPDTPICSAGQAECQYDSEKNFAFDNIESNLKRDRGVLGTGPLSCNCLPMCTDIAYNLEISQNPWNWKERLKKYIQMNISLDGVEQHLDVHFSSIALSFKTNHIETKERHAVYSFADFLSNFGGLLGLFTGFSILSFVEIIYFLTIRLISNVKRYGKILGGRKIV